MSDPTYHKGPRNYGTGFDMMDRIEELEAACWRMQEERDRAIAWRDSDKDRADKAEAKLAKAVEALERIGSGEFSGRVLASMPPQDAAESFAKIVLAELKGTDK